MNNLEYYFATACMIAYFISHIIANLPPKVTEKIPNFVMVIINLLSANYNHSSDSSRDIKGNAKVNK